MATEIEKLTVALRAEAQAWEKAMQKQDPEIGSKIWAYLVRKEPSAQLSTLRLPCCPAMAQSGLDLRQLYLR